MSSEAEAWLPLVTADRDRLVRLAREDRAALIDCLKALGLTKVGQRARAEAWCLQQSAAPSTQAGPRPPPAPSTQATTRPPPSSTAKEIRTYAPISINRTLVRFRLYSPARSSQPVPCYESPDTSSRVVERLVSYGHPITGSAEFEAANGEPWVRVIAPADGFVQLALVAPIGSGVQTYELAPRPSTMLPEPPRSPDADVTFTVTFNGRLDVFLGAMSSVLTALEPSELSTVDAWVVVCDGGASYEHRDIVQRAFPWMTFVGKGRALHRHPFSLNMLLASFVRTRYWLMWEDDWTLPIGGQVLSRARDVLESAGVQQVAVNGAWLDDSEALSRSVTAAGTAYAEIVYPEADRSRVRGYTGLGHLEALVRAYNAGKAL
eukprot:3843163-Prymnesium_polylepis.3